MRMKLALAVVVVVGVAVAMLPAGARAGDKAGSTLINPVGFPSPALGNPILAGPVGTAFTNGTSKGKTKGDDKCKVQVKLSGLTLPDSDQLPGTGDEVICLGEATVFITGLPIVQATVLRGEVKSGGVKISVDLSLEGVGCVPEGGLSNVPVYDSRLTCYEPDAAFTPVINLPLSSTLTHTYKQGVHLGPGVGRPAVMLATQGLHFL